jgi:hypothetical protein
VVDEDRTWPSAVLYLHLKDIFVHLRYDGDDVVGSDHMIWQTWQLWQFMHSKTSCVVNFGTILVMYDQNQSQMTCNSIRYI